MNLLSGADISIRREGTIYKAIVIVGNTSQYAIADDPVRALGMAIILKAGFTENGLKKELEKK